MKKFVTLLWTVAVIGCLTVIAYADVIAGPMIVLWAITRLWPWLLVAIVVILTLMMLRKYRKKYEVQHEKTMDNFADGSYAVDPAPSGQCRFSVGAGQQSIFRSAL